MPFSGAWRMAMNLWAKGFFEARYLMAEYQYIYSFVGNVSLLTEVQQNAKCSFIIPVSLKDQYNELREIPHAYLDKEA